MPEKNDSPTLGDIAKSVKDVGDRLDSFVKKEDLTPIDTKLTALEADITGIRNDIKTKDKVLEDPYLGFKSTEDFWHTLVCSIGAKGNVPPEAAMKLMKGDGGYLPKVRELLKSTTGFNEAQDADGGIFLVDQIASGLLKTEASTAGFAASALNFPVAQLTYSMNALVDKNHTTSVSGGVTVSRLGEGVSPTKSKAAFEKVSWKVTKQGGYTDITEEMLEDAGALSSMIPMLFAQQFEFEAEADFLYDGTGAGEPLAALHANNPAILTVSKEVGQAADTIVLANLLKMRARIYNYAQAFWYATHDIIPQIAQITLGNSPIFLPSGTADVSDTILGRPVKYTEHASALGDLNDIALVEPKQYGIANRRGVTSQSSIHVRFLQGETTLRFTKRNDGQPLWKSVLTPKKGNTRSPFVNLEAR